MSNSSYALTGFGFVIIDEAGENIDGIVIEITGDTVIGPMGLFVALEDTFADTYYLEAEKIKLREISESEINKLKQFAQDNNIDIKDEDIGWITTGYYG